MIIGAKVLYPNEFRWTISLRKPLVLPYLIHHILGKNEVITDDNLYDLFLHKRDTSFTLPEVLDWTKKSGGC